MASRRLGAVLLAAGTLFACTTTEAPSPDVTTSPAENASPSDSDPTGSVEGGTLRYALGANPVTIDPRFASDEEGLTVVDALFDSLVEIDDDLETILPAAADSWEVSDDGLTYRFTLREDGRYHDGSRVVAGDFVRSFRRIVQRDANPQSFLFYQLEPVRGYEEALAGEGRLDGVRAVNARTLEIRLRRPAAEFLQVLAHPSLAPVPQGASGDEEAFAEQPVGNGPFAMAEPWQENQFIRVSRFPGHHDPAQLDEVVFQIFDDDASGQQQYDDFQEGRVDVAEVPPEQMATARASHGVAEDGTTGPGVIDGLTGTVYYYGFNTELPPFDDVNVRRALSLLIDRGRIVDEILLGTRVAADALVPSVLPGSQPGVCDLCRYDPGAALEELNVEQQGSEPVVEGPLEIVYNTGTTNERIAERVAADIEGALGTRVTTRELPLEDLVGELRAGQIGIFRLGWRADYPSPGAVLQPLFRSDTIGQDNLTRYADEQTDQLLDRARATMDSQRRLDLYQQVEARVLEAAPVAPIFFYRHARVVSEAVEGLRLGPLGDLNLAEVRKTSEG